MQACHHSPCMQSCRCVSLCRVYFMNSKITLLVPRYVQEGSKMTHLGFQMDTANANGRDASTPVCAVLYAADTQCGRLSPRHHTYMRAKRPYEVSSRTKHLQRTSHGQHEIERESPVDCSSPQRDTRPFTAMRLELSASAD